MTKCNIPRSGVAGVIWEPGCNKWASCIGIDNTHVHLGVFDDIDDAVMIRYKAEQKLGRRLYIDKSPAEKYLLNKGLIKQIY